MAGALFNPCEVLILDEPTNHIDNSTVDWLERYLGRYTGALLMVTHDRYFLDRVVNRVAELWAVKLYLYDGANYSATSSARLSAKRCRRRPSASAAAFCAASSSGSSAGAGARHQEPVPHRTL
jgi:ATPase subunit of ABC transporter with duplicated ATPase domains